MEGSRDAAIHIEEENVGTSNLIKEEVKKDEGGAFEEKLEDEMDSLNEEEIWRSRRERINNALAAARKAERQDPAEVYAAAQRLISIIRNADVEEFISKIEMLANQIDLSAIFNFLGQVDCSLLHSAANADNYDVLRLLLDCSPKHPLADQDSAGNTPLHAAIFKNSSRAAAMLIRWIRDLPDVEDKNRILRQQNKQGNTALHIAVSRQYADVVRDLLNEDSEPVYWKNKDQKSPLYLAIEFEEPKIHEILFSLPLEPSRIQGLPPIHGAVMHNRSAKYGRTSVVRYMLKHPRQGRMVYKRDHAGNTALHLAAMHSQPATLIPLVLDERIDPFLLNHQPSTTLDIALNCVRREHTLWKQLTVMVLASACGKRPIGNEAFPIIDADKKKPSMDLVKNLINNRSVVATLVATTFAAGFAVPGGFNSSDMASKDDRGMATMLDNRLFQAFAICNTIAMFCSMIAVISLLWAQQNDVCTAMVAYRRSMLPLKIALPAMSTAFLTGVTLTVGKLPWLANTIFYLGLIFLVIISVGKLLEDPPLICSRRRPIRIMVSWLVHAYIYLWEVETDVLDDSEEDRTAG
ncbi:hypothetical protein BT93_K1959 [Corymbia citriodora subsp. variegata]|nr:hypothetical protein BT93_K1959 [Corymbia citriodora subsp. variegata]